MTSWAKPFAHVAPLFHADDSLQQSRRADFNTQGIHRMSPAAGNGKSPLLGKGFAHLGVEMIAGQSAATSVYASSPLKMLVPRPRGKSVWAYLSSFGGGLVAGDETNVTVKMGANTCAFLSTQASTKVYRNPNGQPCGQQLRADLDAGAALVFAPDPVQAFADAGYSQRQEFYLQIGSALVLVDWLCSGRMARGERWAFNSYRSRNDVFLNGERIFIDSLALDSAQVSLGDSHGMGRFNCLATVVVIGASLQAFSTQLLQAIAARPIARRASLLCSASAIAHGTVLRLAGEQVEEVGHEIRRQLAFVTEFLQDDPWARKW